MSKLCTRVISLCAIGVPITMYLSTIYVSTEPIHPRYTCYRCRYHYVTHTYDIHDRTSLSQINIRPSRNPDTVWPLRVSNESTVSMLDKEGVPCSQDKLNSIKANVTIFPRVKNYLRAIRCTQIHSNAFSTRTFCVV